MSLDTAKLAINGLSVLELCLLVAMSHLTEKLDDKPFNCEMVYQGELQALQATS
jgi:origin recognition complex subunit 4